MERYWSLNQKNGAISTEVIIDMQSKLNQNKHFLSISKDTMGANHLLSVRDFIINGFIKVMLQNQALERGTRSQGVSTYARRSRRS